MQLKNNTILITGGTSGIGLALAEALAQRGNQIIVVGRNAAKLQATQQRHPNFRTFQADVSQVAEVTALQTWLAAEFPSLNVVINSAGIMTPHNLLDEATTVASLMTDIQVDLMGTVAVDKSLLPQLASQSEAMIVNISSGLANVSSAAHPTYSAAKAGVHMFTSALRDQLRFAEMTNVHVMELVPPLVSETNLEPRAASAGSADDMKLVDLVAATMTGMANNALRVNAGAAAALRKAGQTDPDNTEWQMAQLALPQYFPQGLR